MMLDGRATGSDFGIALLKIHKFSSFRTQSRIKTPLRWRTCRGRRNFSRKWTLPCRRGGCIGSPVVLLDGRVGLKQIIS